uniref:Uncharacterized protein n=1 Tax=Oryza brachyantha TaxID=4533 RepID=J3MVH0_ORYBR
MLLTVITSLFLFLLMIGYYLLIQWRIPDGLPISVLKMHTGVVTAIAFSPRAGEKLRVLL